MVTCTLKLGISILNGGNVQVQQVRLRRSDIQLCSRFVLRMHHSYVSVHISVRHVQRLHWGSVWFAQ